MARLTRSEAEVLLAARAYRGMTWKELSDESGVPISTLQKWKDRIGRSDRSAFVEAIPRTVSTSCSFEIVIGEVTVRVANGFDPESLASILRVIEEC